MAHPYPVKYESSPAPRHCGRPRSDRTGRPGSRPVRPIAADRLGSPAARLLGLVLALGPAAGSQAALGQAASQSATPRDPFEGAPAGPLLRDDVAGSRQIPGYKPQGLDLGALHLDPSIMLRGDASSNLFNRSAGRRGDVAATLAPALLATGQAGQTRFVLDARAALARYDRATGYNSDTWALRAQAALPVAARLRVAASVAANRVMEPPYEAAGASAVDGGVVLVDQVRGGLGGEVDFGKTRLTASFDLARGFPPLPCPTAMPRAWT